MKRFLHIMLSFILILLVILLLIPAMLYMPIVQKHMVKTVPSLVSRYTDWGVKMDYFRLRFPANLDLRGVEVVTPQGDTLLHLGQLTTRMQFKPLVRQRLLVVDKVVLQNVILDLSKQIKVIDIAGRIGFFELTDAKVDIRTHSGNVRYVALEEAKVDMELFLQLKDTLKQTTNPPDWEFDIDSMRINHVEYSLIDTMRQLDIFAHVEQANMYKGHLRLVDNTYTVEEFKLINSDVKLDLNHLSPAEGFDPLHLDISDINLQCHAIYSKIMELRVSVDHATMRERSGLEVRSLSGEYRMDSTGLMANNLQLTTPSSKIDANGQLDLSIFRTPRVGKAEVNLDAKISNSDLLIFTNTYVPALKTMLPKEELSVEIDLSGDMNRLILKKIDATLPKSFHLKGDGFVNDLNNPKITSANLKFNAGIANIAYATQFLPNDSLRKDINIPTNMKLKGDLVASAGEYKGDVMLTHKYSKLSLNGNFHPIGERYAVKLVADSFQLASFMPNYGVGILSATIDAKGAGFKPELPSTHVATSLEIKRLELKESVLRTIKLQAELNNQNYQIQFSGTDSILMADLNLSGIYRKNWVTADLLASLTHVDLYKLNLAQEDVIFSMSADLKASSDLKEEYNLKSQLSEITFIEKGKTSRLGTLLAETHINADSTKLILQNGDLLINVEAISGLNPLIASLKGFVAKITNQLNSSNINISELQQEFPEMDMQISIGTQNLLHSWLKNIKGISYESANIYLSNHQLRGMQLQGLVEEIRKDTFQISQLDFNITQQYEKFDYRINALSPHKNLSSSLNLLATGAIHNQGLNINLLLKNGKEVVGFDLGAELTYRKEGISLHIIPFTPVLFFKQWQINPDNHIEFSADKRIKANFMLTGEKGMHLSVHSIEPHRILDADALKIEVRDFDLKQVSNLMPTLPPFSGIFQTALVVEMKPGKMDIEGVAGMDELYYNKIRLGDLSLNMNYVLGVGEGQKGDASLSLDGQDVLLANLQILPSDTAGMQVRANLASLPLKLVNPFIPDAMASMGGIASGEVMMSGDFKYPIVNGLITLDTARVNISYANADLRLDKQPIEIRNSVVNLTDYKILAYNQNPLVLNGTFSFVEFARMALDLKVTGSNVEILDVKKQKNQMIFGRMLVNVNTQINGPLNLLKLRGNLSVLGGSNITYVLLDSPTTARNRISNLVAFKSFSDTLNPKYNVETEVKGLSGVDVIVGVGISEDVVMAVDLSSNGDDHVQLKGGGDLTFRMSPIGDMDLAGRYTLNGGFVRYTLPVISVPKTFEIRGGSYVEWTGQLLDPYVNIQAFERIRSSITEDGKGSRVVVFDAIIAIRNKLDNLNLSFAVDAPEDITIQNQIASMTSEERSRQAISLLVTGIYTGPGTTSKLNANSPVNAFIQKEINQFAGNMLKGVDVSVGIDSYNQYGAEGESGKQTDYTFRVSKRLLNDRFIINIGGKLSSGQQAVDQQQSFIDNLSLEYRLDKGSSRYLKLFHNTNYESVFEGQIIETGLAVVLKRKVMRLRQLFIFNERKREAAINKEKSK